MPMKLRARSSARRKSLVGAGEHEARKTGGGGRARGGGIIVESQTPERREKRIGRALRRCAERRGG